MKTVYRVELDTLNPAGSRDSAPRIWVAADNGVQVESALRDVDHLVRTVKPMHGVVPVGTDMDYILPDEADRLQESIRQIGDGRRRSA